MSLKNKKEKKHELKDQGEKKDLHEILKILKNIDTNLSVRRQITRSFLMGMAQILGATIGIAIIFFFIGRVINKMENVPIVKDLIAKSGLVQVVREEMERHSK